MSVTFQIWEQAAPSPKYLPSAGSRLLSGTLDLATAGRR